MNPRFLSPVTAVIVTSSDLFGVGHHASENNGSECGDDSRSFQEPGLRHSKSPSAFFFDLNEWGQCRGQYTGEDAV
ncbi:MAG TPA: hypothetical protein VGF61_23515 [Candidatus Acidoferrum sp.]